MPELTEIVDAEVRPRGLLRRNQRVLVAVSGGVDSMVLLHVLRQLAAARKWRLSVAHFNHRLRGRASDADARFVAAAARAMRLPFLGGAGEVRRHARATGQSIEMAARELRHAFLVSAARECRANVIALAHHADDQVELFLLRLLRGSGAEGLRGMRWQAPSPCDPKLTLIRPLLACRKAELLEFARRHKIQFREDASNRHQDPLRNRVRHRLLPLLRREFSSAVDALVLRAMDILGEQASHLATEAARWNARRSAFHKSPVALQREILRGQLIQFGVRPEFDLIERLRTQLGVACEVASGTRLLCDEHGVLRPVARVTRGFSTARRQLRLRDQRGGVTFDGVRIEWRLSKLTRLPPNLKQPRGALEQFDADKVGVDILLRHWLPGDRFQPLGLRAAAKLQDIFTNRKIPVTRRRQLLVGVAACGEIFWVEALPPGEKFKLDKDSRSLLKWRWNRSPRVR